MGCHWRAGRQEDNGIIMIIMNMIMISIIIIMIIVVIIFTVIINIVMSVLVVEYNHYNYAKVYWVGEGIQGLQGKLTRSSTS